MSFKSLNHILSALETQAQWQEEPFPRLLKCWHEIVGAAIASHTRPLSIQRDVLRVATSSAAWAQNLTFQRQLILEKLNAQLPSPLVDIRFSTAEWHRPQGAAKGQQPDLQREHPSYLGEQVNLADDIQPNNKDVTATFERWAKVRQARSHNLPLCPQCHSPTPPGELQRWDVCSICATKRW